MLLLFPDLRNQQQDVAAGNVHRPVQDPLGPVARDRDPHLLADMAVTRVKGGSLRDDRLIGNATSRCVWLLSAGGGQCIHGFNGTKDVHVGDAFAFSISSRLYVRPCKDRDDPVLNVA